MYSCQDIKKIGKNKSRFMWDKERVSLYKRAAKYTGYNDEISKIVGREIGKDRTIWDLGCGMSNVSLGLSHISKSISCVDISTKVLVSLAEVAREEDINNVEIVNMDYKDFLRKKGPGDCIIASHFLNMYSNMELLLDHCKTLVIIKNSEQRKTDSFKHSRKQTIEEIEDNILKKDYDGIKYKSFIHEGDFGQPLKSIEEAKRYYESYSNKEISLEEVSKFLVETEDLRYPYYFPKDKSTGILIIEGRA